MKHTTFRTAHPSTARAPRLPRRRYLALETRIANPGTTARSRRIVISCTRHNTVPRPIAVAPGNCFDSVGHRSQLQTGVVNSPEAGRGRGKITKWALLRSFAGQMDDGSVAIVGCRSRSPSFANRQFTITVHFRPTCVYRRNRTTILARRNGPVQLQGSLAPSPLGHCLKCWRFLHQRVSAGLTVVGSANRRQPACRTMAGRTRAHFGAVNV